jgi:hypothetical protein
VTPIDRTTEMADTGMAGKDGTRPYFSVVELIRRNRHVADNPSYSTIGRVSGQLHAQQRAVEGVRVEPVPSSTANDLLLGKPRQLKWATVSSLWAVLYWIAEQDDRLDTSAMHSLQELRACFNSIADRPGSGSTTPGRRASTGVFAGGHQAATGSGGAVGLEVTDLARTGLLDGGPEPGLAPRRHHQRQLATEGLLAAARERRPTAWWADYDDVVPEWFGPLLTLEQEASSVRTYAPHRFPGLLQTADYARYAIGRDMPGIDQATVARLIDLRMLRRALLRRSDPPSYVAIVGHRAVHDDQAPAAVMRDQLKHLITMASFQHITVQLVDDRDADQLIRPTPTTIMRFTVPGYGDLAYLEHHELGTYHLAHSEVAYFGGRYNNLLVKAKRPDETVRTLLEVLDRLQP